MHIPGNQLLLSPPRSAARRPFPSLAPSGEPLHVPLLLSLSFELLWGARWGCSLSFPNRGVMLPAFEGGVLALARLSDPAASEGDAASYICSRDLLGLKWERMRIHCQGGISKAGWGCLGQVGAGSSLTSLTPELETRTSSQFIWAFGGAVEQRGHPKMGPQPPLMLCGVISLP